MLNKISKILWWVGWGLVVVAVILMLVVGINAYNQCQQDKETSKNPYDSGGLVVGCGGWLWDPYRPGELGLNMFSLFLKFIVLPLLLLSQLMVIIDKLWGRRVSSWKRIIFRMIIVFAILLLPELATKAIRIIGY